MHCCLFLTNMQFCMGLSGSIYLIILDWRGFISVLSGRYYPVHEKCSYPLIHVSEISVLKHSECHMHIFPCVPSYAYMVEN